MDDRQSGKRKSGEAETTPLCRYCFVSPSAEDYSGKAGKPGRALRQNPDSPHLSNPNQSALD